MDYDQEELIAAMYQSDGESVNKPVQIVSPEYSRSRRIMVGAIGYEVPTLDYVLRLEQTVTRQNALMDDLRRQVASLESFVKSTRNFIRRQTHHISEMQSSLDGKIGKDNT